MDDRTWIKARASNSQGNCVEMSPWVKASASSDTGSCVEHRAVEGGVDVRDSKDATGPVLHFTAAEFAAWLDGAKGGEFDHLV